MRGSEVQSQPRKLTEAVSKLLKKWHWEDAPWLGTYTAVPEDLCSVPITHEGHSQLPEMLDPGDLTPTSGLYRQLHTPHTNIKIK